MHVLDHQIKILEALAGTDVGDIWGIGSQYASWLYQHHITNALQLTQAPEEWLRRRMTLTGHRLVKELKGISCISLEEVMPLKKAICTSRSLYPNMNTRLPVRLQDDHRRPGHQETTPDATGSSTAEP